MVYVALNILRNLTLMSRCLVELGPLLAAGHMGILAVRVQAHLNYPGKNKGEGMHRDQVGLDPNIT